MKSIVVFGQSRSGTTIIARLLDKLGVDFPEPGIPKSDDVDNPWLYEHELANSNWRFLTRRRDSKWNEAFTDFGDLDLQNYQKVRNKFKELVDERKAELWGYKSPALVHCWRVFVDLIPNPHFVIVHRNLDSVARSYSSQTDKTVEESRRIAEFRNHLIFQFISENDDPKIHLHFEDLFLKPDKSIEKISNFIGVEPDYSVKEKIKLSQKHY